MFTRTPICYCTFDGYELSFLVSYFDSPPRSSTSSELCFRNSRCGMLSTSWMMDKNLTQLRNNFWLIRLPDACFRVWSSQHGFKKTRSKHGDTRIAETTRSLHVLYMEISTLGHAKIRAATNRHTEMVLPNRRGVEILYASGGQKTVCQHHSETK